jgi:hypothetical protein
MFTQLFVALEEGALDDSLRCTESVSNFRAAETFDEVKPKHLAVIGR